MYLFIFYNVYYILNICFLVKKKKKTIDWQGITYGNFIDLYFQHKNDFFFFFLPKSFNNLQ